ncbi:Alpha/Beta hydrolase protein [Xylariales sp. AK1849]|nr:Alpha/Beta hydrolase protein [Xylariales sp. AK1849]
MMLRKATYTYATHVIPVECDVYDVIDYPLGNPVFLFFHCGGLVGGARICVPPWLAQACYQRKWPLISASYRLLPQAGSKGLLEDASAAHEFAQSWKAENIESRRRVIVGGASAGFFMACLIAHHLTPAPAAILCITGIPTFRHAFFNSSTLLTPEPIKDEEMAEFINAPTEAETTPEDDRTVFALDQILLTGLKNPNYVRPARSTPIVESGVWDRGCMYDYYLYKNAYLGLVGDVDPGFTWAKEDPDSEKIREWPPGIFIQGDNDHDVSMDVITHVVDCLGPKKATLCLAKGEGHLFEATSFLEDDGEAMDTVRQAIAVLDEHF